MTHLHRQLRLCRPPRRRLMAAGGYALPVVLVAGFVATLGAVSLSSRALSTRVSDEFQAQAIAAREAADSGLEAVIAEFNKNQNRALAGSKVAMHTWNATNPELRNQCFQQGGTAPTAAALAVASGAWQTNPGNPNLRYRIRSAEVKTALRDRRLFSNITAKTSNETKDAQGRSYSPFHVLDPTPTGVTPQQFSRLELIVEGQSLLNNQVVATSAVTTELNVLPKNCGFSVEGKEECPAGTFCNGSFPRLLIGLDGGGVLQAAAGSTLRQQISGSTATDNTKKLDSILCINTSGTCGGTIKTSVDGVPIQTLQLTLPPLPSFPAKDSVSGAASGSNGIQIIANCRENFSNTSNSITIDRDGSGGNSQRTCARSNTKDYLRVNSSGAVELCNVTNNNTSTGGTGEPNMPASFVNNSCDSNINQFCVRTGDKPENRAYHCRISRLHVRDDTRNDGEANRIQNNTFFIDSSRFPIYLHFNTPWASPGSCGSSGATTEICTEAGWDDGQIQHLNCTTASDSTPCNQRALPDQSPRVILYSLKENTANCSKLVPKPANCLSPVGVRIGDDGYIRDMFLYLPKGNVTLAEDPDSSNNAFGLPNFRGSMWIDNLTMSLRTNYSTAISVPPFSDTFFGFGTNPTTDNPFKSFVPLYEWTVVGANTRSVYSASN